MIPTHHVIAFQSTDIHKEPGWLLQMQSFNSNC